jgi:hypothetical protein
MKTKTKFDSTSDARNLINSVVEKFPKGPERDGLQTKLREFYNCFVGAMRLPQGYDRSKVIEEGTQNLHAAQRIADRIDKQNGNAKFLTMISILASKLTDLKRDHSKTGKVEDNFYGKRVVKGIFAKAKFNFRDVGDAHQKAIAIKTLKNPSLALLGGPTAEEAESILRKKFNYTDKQIAELKKYEGSRTGSKAKFAKEYILWAVPKGKTDTMYSQPIAEQLYTDAQINDVKRRATADGWHTFRIAEMMSFEDMTNAFKGKPVKRRSSRTGSKARFDFKPPANWIFDTMVSYARHYQDLGGYKGDAIYERAIDMAQKILSMPDFQRKGKSAHAVARHIIKNEGALKMNLARTGAKAKFEEINKNSSYKEVVFDLLHEFNVDTSNITYKNGILRLPKEKYSQVKGILMGSFRISKEPKYEQFARTGAKAKFANKDINLKIASLRSKILKLNELLQNAKETENTQEFARLVQKIKIEEKNLKVAYDVANLYGGMSRTGAKAKFGDPVYGKDPVSSASNKVVLKLKGGITATLIRQNGEWSVIEFPNAKTFRNLQVMYQYLSGKANSDKLSELK